MTPERIKTIRLSLGENTKEFGERFARSSRSVEDWEQGRRNPDALVISLLEKLEADQQKKDGKKSSKKPK